MNVEGTRPLKRCNRCGEWRKFIEYPLCKRKRDPGARGTICNPCKAKSAADWYVRNQATRLQTDAKRRLNPSVKRRRQLSDIHRYEITRTSIQEFLDWLKLVPCMDCCEVYPPYCMDFDHRPEEIKVANISKIAHCPHPDQDKLMAEIYKCDLVCAICHRIRTFKRKQNK